MGSMSLPAMDLEQIANCGLTVEEVLRQIDLVKCPPRYVKLQRPCLPGCGIDVFDAAHAEACVAAFEAACAQGRFLKFVSAARAAGRTGLRTLHRSPSGVRTVFEEHLIEAASYVRDRNGLCRLHVTASPEHVARCERLLASVRAEYATRCNAHFLVNFSMQYARTDTVAVDRGNRPLRDAAGRLLFRPGGHQALIEKLNDLCGDLIFIKNTDDVVPDDCRGPMLHWKKVLGGHLVRVQREIFRFLARLGSTSTPATDLCDALHFVRDALGVGLPTRVIGAGAHQLRDFVVATLDRPVRICGMVRGDDNLGGGPFWVKGRDGTSTRQIVETAQVDPDAPDQRAVLRAATHFNPVDLVCGVRNWRGEPFDLRRYVDPTAGLIGLCNGAMADWTTIFVEVPAATFRPRNPRTTCSTERRP